MRSAKIGDRQNVEAFIVHSSTIQRGTESNKLHACDTRAYIRRMPVHRVQYIHAEAVARAGTVNFAASSSNRSAFFW